MYAVAKRFLLVAEGPRVTCESDRAWLWRQLAGIDRDLNLAREPARAKVNRPPGALRLNVDLVGLAAGGFHDSAAGQRPFVAALDLSRLIARVNGLLYDRQFTGPRGERVAGRGPVVTKVERPPLERERRHNLATLKVRRRTAPLDIVVISLGRAGHYAPGLETGRRRSRAQESPLPEPAVVLERHSIVAVPLVAADRIAAGPVQPVFAFQPLHGIVPSADVGVIVALRSVPVREAARLRPVMHGNSRSAHRVPALRVRPAKIRPRQVARVEEQEGPSELPSGIQVARLRRRSTVRRGQPSRK